MLLDDAEEIRTVYARNAQALSEGDLDTLVDLYAEGAIQQPTHAPPVTGRAAIRRSLEHELSGRQMWVEIEVLEIEVANDWAYARGSYTIDVPAAHSAAHSLTRGHWLDILRRQTDGSWKITRSTWSSEDRHRIEGQASES